MVLPGNQSAGLRIALIGGIGAGKTTAARILGELGATVIEADEIGHQVLESGGAAYGRVAARWPGVVERGVIDRAALARIVFSDPGQLRELEAMTHPAIVDEILRRAALAGSRDVVVELPIDRPILGDGWVRVALVADDEVRVGRAVSRGWDEDDVRRRLAAQPATSDWMDAADRVISNEGSVAELRSQIEELWAELRRT